jgi:radical SAM protein with 4Fe4S-binding SPASM domain
MVSIKLCQQRSYEHPNCSAREQSGPKDLLSWENLIYIVDFLAASRVTLVSLSGDEPFLHPDIIDFILYICARGMRVQVFTGGIFPAQILAECTDEFSQIAPDRLQFVCNLRPAGELSEQERKSLVRFLRVFGPLTVPAFLIDKTDFCLEPVFEDIMSYGLMRCLRLSLAHPVAGQRASFVAPSRIKEIGRALSCYADSFSQLGIRPELDCGFPLCAFSERQLGAMFKTSGGRLIFSCTPGVDVSADMRVQSCQSLRSVHERSLFEFTSLLETTEHFQRLHSAARVESGGIYRSCDECRWREEHLCAGGCLAQSFKRFEREEPVRLQEVYG